MRTWQKWGIGIAVPIGLILGPFWYDQWKSDRHYSACKSHYEEADNARADMVDAHAAFLANRTGTTAVSYLSAATAWTYVVARYPDCLSDSALDFQQAAHDFGVLTYNCQQQIEADQILHASADAASSLAPLRQ